MSQTIHVTLEKGMGFPTLNDFFGKGHWTKRTKLKKRLTPFVINAINGQAIRPVEHYPVYVQTALYFGKGHRRFDWENCAIVVKVVQDVLIDRGILADDGPKYIYAGCMHPVKTQEPVCRVAYSIRQKE